MGKPAATDRPRLTPLSHSFTLDLVVGFQHRTEAGRFLKEFRERLAKFGLELHPDKTRLIEFSDGTRKGLIAYPTRKSIRRFRDRVRMLTRRSAQRKTAALIEELNPTLRGWAEYYKRAHVRTLFHKLDGWIVRRIWSHRFCRWRTRGWIQLPKAKLYAEFGLVNLISLIPSLGSHSRSRASS